MLCNTVKTRIKEHTFLQFRMILFLYIGCFLQNQPEDVLKVFLKLVLEIIYCIDY